MQIVGAGLSKTGTRSLHRALELLGYKSLHYDKKRLNDVLDGSDPDPDFRRYDDLDAVLDLPAAWYFQEILAAYPAAKCILTVRDEDSWWPSIEEHFNSLVPVPRRAVDPFRWQLRNLVYGSATAEEEPYRQVYRAHNARVRDSLPSEQLLVLDIVAGQGWEALCPFLGVPEPDLPFPHEYSRKAFRQGVRASRRRPQIARNAPCPCGSGLRFKKCHGRLSGL